MAPSDLRNDADALTDELAALRRQLHQVPELGFDLPLTQPCVLRALEGLPLEITMIATRRGTLLSSASMLRVTVRGAGGHASRPHRAADPVPAMAEMLTGLQVLVTRRFDAFDPVIVSVGLVRAGSKWNVIPETASFEVSVRTFSRAHRDAITERAVRLFEGIAAAHGLGVDVEVVHWAPTTVNDDQEADRITRVASEPFGTDRVHEYAHPQPGSEDFAYVLEEVPGAMAFLGACAPGTDPAVAAYNHSSHARYDESVVSDGAALLAALALDRLSEGRHRP